MPSTRKGPLPVWVWATLGALLSKATFGRKHQKVVIDELIRRAGPLPAWAQKRLGALAVGEIGQGGKQQKISDLGLIFDEMNEQLAELRPLKHGNRWKPLSELEARTRVGKEFHKSQGAILAAFRNFKKLNSQGFYASTTFMRMMPPPTYAFTDSEIAEEIAIDEHFDRIRSFRWSFPRQL